MKRLALLLLPLLAVVALVMAVWPADETPTASHPGHGPHARSHKSALPALGGSRFDPARIEALARVSVAEPLLMQRVKPVADSHHGSPSERGFAPPATETGLIIEPPKPVITDPNDSRFYKPQVRLNRPDRSPTDTAQGARPLQPSQLEDHGAPRFSALEDHKQGKRETVAPGVSRTASEYLPPQPPKDVTRSARQIERLRPNHPLLARTRAPQPKVPRWTGVGTDTRVRPAE